MADLRTPAEIKYDATSLFLKPAASQDDQLISLLEDMYGKDGADTPISPEEEKIISVLFPSLNAPSAIEIRHAYHNLAEDRDICFDANAGPVAYTDFILGAEEDESRAEISFQADGTCEPYIYLCGHDGIPLSKFVGALDNLLTLLDDPRVGA
jgi:hypothetical protein